MLSRAKTEISAKKLTLHSCVTVSWTRDTGNVAWLGETIGQSWSICCSFWIRNWSQIATRVVVLGVTLFKKAIWPRRFKSDRDGEMWQDCSSSKYASIDRVGNFYIMLYF